MMTVWSKRWGGVGSREMRWGKSLVERGRGGRPGSGCLQWQYCTYVRVGGHRVITLDGVSLPTSQDHWPTDLGFGAIRNRGTFGRGLQQIKKNNKQLRVFVRIISILFFFFFIFIIISSIYLIQRLIGLRRFIF